MPNKSTPVIFDSCLPEFQKRRQQVHATCRQFYHSPTSEHLKQLKSLFKQCGKRVFIEPGFHCDYANKISLGDRVYFNINCTLLDGGSIEVGNDCLIGPNVQIITINHSLSAQERLKKENYAQNVIIGKNVWIGASTIILPGVTIEDNAVIGAGSIVSKKVEANCLYLGNPARKVRELN